MLPNLPNRLCLLAAASILFAGVSLGVTTSRWTHTSESDFKEGTLHHLVATSSGDLQLSRAVKTLVEQDPRYSLVSALAEAPDGTLYIGTGPSGLLQQWKDGKASDVLSLGEGVSVSALALDRSGALLIGTGGASAKVLRLGADHKPAPILEDPAIRYVWALEVAEDGAIYAATGPEGNLYEIRPDGSSRVLFHSNDANIISLALSGDTLYAGTSSRGLVYRIGRKTGEGFVLFDAPETDITSLVLDEKGNLYAATGAETQTAERPSMPQVGRPEVPSADVPIRSEPPTAPKPPALPDPNPGEPQPIPKVEPGKTEPAAPVTPMHSPGRTASPSPLWLLVADDADDVESPAMAPTTAPTRPQMRGPRPPVPQPPQRRPQGQPQGNAIYRISPEGFVSEIFRQPALFYTMARQGETLLIGSGSDGVVYQHNTLSGETLAIARVEAVDVTKVLLGRGGRVYLGVSNTGGLLEMTAGFAASGTFTSPVLDAAQVSRFGTLQLVGTLATDATLGVSFRSGNVEDADEPGWSPWTPEVAATEFVKITSPAARFLQYRLTFASKEGDRSAVVDEVTVSYQMPNLPPVVRAVSAEREPGTPEAPSPNVAVAWDAADPNTDALRYQLHYRMGRRAPWIELKKNLTAGRFTWNTRTVADGRYQLRVTAGDALSNPEGGKTATRLSEWVVVDNTPPVIGDVETKVTAGVITCALRVVDRTSTVATVEYAVDSADDWQAATASDNMLDSPDETLGFVTKRLDPGPHQIAVRATDSAGNRAHTTLVVTVE
jgi:hypothetical protein